MHQGRCLHSNMELAILTKSQYLTIPKLPYMDLTFVIDNVKTE